MPFCKTPMLPLSRFLLDRFIIPLDLKGKVAELRLNLVSCPEFSLNRRLGKGNAQWIVSCPCGLT